MRILVTGGAGFIGSEFTRALLGGAYSGLAGPDVLDVVVLDKLTYAGSLANLDGVVDDARLRFVEGDIADAATVADVLPGTDVVVNFAAESHVDRSIAGAAEFVATNVGGTHVLLAGALAAGVGRFVQVSTDEVYGSIADGAWVEEQPLAPNSPYAASKAAADLLALAFHRTHGLDVRITRCSNNYGPHQFPEKLIPLFVNRMLDGLPVPLYGDGGNEREWVHVADHCRGVALVAQDGRAGEVYHLGGGTALSNLAITSRLLELTGADPALVQRVPDRLGHDRRYALDDGKAARELGYAPAVAFDEGLAATVDWYREHRGWTRASLARAA
jgi:dTDP-glucose 4,6-dehydratase